MKLSEVMPSEQDVIQQRGQGGLLAGNRQAPAGPQPEQQPEQQPGPQAPQPGPETGEADSETPTPQEQDQYNRIVLAGVKILSQAADQIIALLQKQANAPAKALGETTWTIMSAVDEKGGGQFDPAVLLMAGAEVMQNVGEFAKEGGVFEVDEALINKAWQLVMVRFETEFGVDFGAEFGPEAQAMDPAQFGQLAQQQQAYSQVGEAPAIPTQGAPQ